MRFSRLFIAVLFFIPLLSSPAAAKEVSPLRIIYFVPSDCNPCPAYEERLDRVMTEIQQFYRKGMKAAGYGPLTFELERHEDNRLRVYLVHGDHPLQYYDRNSGDKVRGEVKTQLQPKGLDIDQETIVIFQVLLRWDQNKATEVGAYCGGGNNFAGTAFVYDDERLDPRLLSSKAPGGYYYGPCSLGQFNSHYIGGVAHELGHALGLPHDCERQADRACGTSLMGGGNHTYGQERRNEGSGTFLTAASAMPLIANQRFATKHEAPFQDPPCTIDGLEAACHEGKLLLSGHVRSKPQAYGIVAYNDSQKIPNDYDAVGWVGKVAEDGRFQVEIGELNPGSYQLRLSVCRPHAVPHLFAFNYAVDGRHKPELQVFRHAFPLHDAVIAYARGDKAQAKLLAEDLKKRFADVPEVQRKASHLLALLHPAPLTALEEIPAGQKSVAVSRLQFQKAKVGWGPPLRDQVGVEPPRNCFLEVGGQFYESGLYAHAPSVYQLDLNRQWKRFRSTYGLQDGHAGSVIFVVRADGREIFRSRLVNHPTLQSMGLDIAGVKQLELAVEDGGDGATNDWGVWVEPRLERDSPASVPEVGAAAGNAPAHNVVFKDQGFEYPVVVAVDVKTSQVCKGIPKDGEIGFDVTPGKHTFFTDAACRNYNARTSQAVEYTLLDAKGNAVWSSEKTMEAKMISLSGGERLEIAIQRPSLAFNEYAVKLPGQDVRGEICATKPNWAYQPGDMEDTEHEYPNALYYFVDPW